jgi:hypothetical protein
MTAGKSAGPVCVFVCRIWTLVVLSYVSMFMLPLAWNAYGKNLRSAATRARDEFHNRVALMGLSRAHAVGIQLLLLVSLWLNSSLATRLISLVVGTIAIRCQLAPNEVRLRDAALLITGCCLGDGALE